MVKRGSAPSHTKKLFTLHVADRCLEFARLPLDLARFSACRFIHEALQSSTVLTLLKPPNSNSAGRSDLIA
jgi:hypothetical protein